MSGPTPLEVALYRVLADKPGEHRLDPTDRLLRGLEAALRRLVYRGLVVREAGGVQVVREMGS